MTSSLSSGWALPEATFSTYKHYNSCRIKSKESSLYGTSSLTLEPCHPLRSHVTGMTWLICYRMHVFWTVSYFSLIVSVLFTSYFVSAIRAASAGLLYLPVLHLYCLSYLPVTKINEWMNEWMNGADIKLYMPMRCYVNNMSDVRTPTPRRSIFPAPVLSHKLGPSALTCSHHNGIGHYF